MNNAQDLKLIAETIGWTNVWIEEATQDVVGYPPEWKTEDVFSPEDNPAQVLEIEDWLFEADYLFFVGKRRSGIYKVVITKGLHVKHFGEGKTLAEALLSTMKEVIK